MEAKLQLELIKGQSGPELWRSKFSRGPFEHNCVRGKISISQQEGCFQWTRAVKAATLVGCLSRLELDQSCLVRGGRGSLASSLDFAVSKCPEWTIDMFGTFPSGSPVIKRLFRRQNPGLRLGGVVAIGLNPIILKSSNIRIFLEGKELSTDQCRVLVKEWIELLKVTERKSLGTLEWFN